MDTRSIESNGWGKFSQRLASEPNRARRKRNAAAVAAKSLQSCLTLCDPIDGSPLGSPIPWILQARTLEWVAIPSPNAWKWKVKVKSLSRVWLFTTPWTAAHQAPPSMGFSRQEYWSWVPSPSPANKPLLCCKYLLSELGFPCYGHRNLSSLYYDFISSWQLRWGTQSQRSKCETLVGEQLIRVGE